MALGGQSLSSIIGNPWTWATSHGYYDPAAPMPAGTDPAVRVILELASAINEGRPISPYFDVPRVSDASFLALVHWLPLSISLPPGWATSSSADVQVSAMPQTKPGTPASLGQNGGFFTVAKMADGTWRIVSVGTGP